VTTTNAKDLSHNIPCFELNDEPKSDT